jgi:hypothetical protein
MESSARLPCIACNAAYRGEALRLFDRLVQGSPAHYTNESGTHEVWAIDGRREAIAEINSDPEPYQWVRTFRSQLVTDGIPNEDIPAAQHCAACVRFHGGGAEV